jgi:hypothetical protein
MENSERLISNCKYKNGDPVFGTGKATSSPHDGEDCTAIYTVPALRPVRPSINCGLVSTLMRQPNPSCKPSKATALPRVDPDKLGIFSSFYLMSEDYSIFLRITLLTSFLHSVPYAPTSLSKQMTCSNGQIPCLSSNAWKMN